MTVIDPVSTRPTLVDVACAAGVSTATASRVLNGLTNVRQETRDQVERAMLTLGYVRHRAPRRLPSDHAGSIALVVCEEGMRLFSDPFFARILGGVSRALASTDTQLVLLITQSVKDYETSVLRYLRSRHADGAMFVSMHGRYPIDLARIGVPVVSTGRPVCAQAARYSYVDSDNHGGAQRAVLHLIESGRKDIATVAGPPDMTPGVDRLAGYRAAITTTRSYDPGLVAHGDFSQPSGEHAVRLLLDRRPDIDAVFVASDLMAMGVLRGLRRAGRRVPDDVAVIGFDDSPAARHTDPPLSTVRQPVEEMGARTAYELLALITDPAAQPRSVVLPTELVLRESA
jgi:DNA-binding LacI/PurR family transcriptional regulator